MQSYPHPSEEHGVALDFTPGRVKINHEISTEVPVLDLSCKKHENHDANQSMSYDMSPLSLETHSRSPPSGELSDNQHHQTKETTTFEGRTFMVTPPSESDSPKKSKYRPIYPKAESAVVNISHCYPPQTSPIVNNCPPIVPSTILLPHLANQNGATVGQIQLPGSTTTTVGTTVDHQQHQQQHITMPVESSDTLKKAPRPFKAYPKDPLAMTMGTHDFIYDPNSNEAYTDFRKRMLESVRKTNEGTNIKMRRVAKSPGLPTSTMDDKDAAYWERRRKNNEAAKRSRDARRAKEDEIAIRAAYLEQENLRLKYEVIALRQETAKLRCMVYSS